MRPQDLKVTYWWRTKNSEMLKENLYYREDDEGILLCTACNSAMGEAGHWTILKFLQDIYIVINNIISIPIATMSNYNFVISYII